MTRIPDPWQPSETLATAIVKFLRTPTTLAVLASVGAHGAFFLGLPIVTGRDTPDLRTVNVVQLSPEEQAKLPGAVPQLPNQPTPTATPSPGSLLAPADPSTSDPNAAPIPDGPLSDATPIYQIPGLDDLKPETELPPPEIDPALKQLLEAQNQQRLEIRRRQQELAKLQEALKKEELKKEELKKEDSKQESPSPEQPKPDPKPEPPKPENSEDSETKKKETAIAHLPPEERKLAYQKLLEEARKKYAYGETEETKKIRQQEEQNWGTVVMNIGGESQVFQDPVLQVTQKFELDPRWLSTVKRIPDKTMVSYLVDLDGKPMKETIGLPMRTGNDWLDEQLKQSVIRQIEAGKLNIPPKEEKGQRLYQIVWLPVNFQ